MHGLNDYKECVNPVIGKPQAKATAYYKRIIGKNLATENRATIRKGITGILETNRTKPYK